MDELRKSIISCYNTYFNHCKLEDMFIKTKDSENVLSRLTTVFNDSNLLDLHGFWTQFLFNGIDKNNTNILNDLGFPNYSLTELYFRYIILRVFNDYIYPSGTRPAMESENGLKIPEIPCTGLSQLLQENRENEKDEVSSLTDSWEFFPKNELTFYTYNPNPLIHLFEPLLNNKSFTKKDARRCIETNQFFIALKRHDCNSTFDVFNEWIDDYGSTKLKSKGFRIKTSHSELFSNIYEIIKDYIQNDNPKNDFNIIFNAERKIIKTPLNLLKNEIWLMPYIISQLNINEIFVFPIKDNHWPTFDHCFLLNNSPFTDAQKRSPNLPNLAKSELLKNLNNLLVDIKNK
ncbi:MAG: hypothetical protein IPL25_08705 [Saprospiraceae bacterium]|nr:hypothetical protein [Candidatus Vicinibacter affinis]